MKNFINDNGRVLTGFVAAFILFGGIAVYQKPQDWWIIPLGIVIFAVITLVTINAISFIKSLIAVLITLLLSAEAFQSGLIISNENTGALWMWLTIFNFFTFLAVSYAKESNQSRWTIITITQVLSFVYFFVLTSSINFRLALILGEILTLATFVVFYYIPLKNLMNNKDMPKIMINEKVLEKIDEESIKTGWDYYVLEKTNTVIMWGMIDDVKYSIVIIPIKMVQPFGVIGRKKLQLSYRGRKINPWLTSVLTYMIPYWKLRNISPLPILYDFDKMNGKETKTIGVKIADRKQPAPFVITPLNSLESILRRYQDIMLPITEKQYKALTELGE